MHSFITAGSKQSPHPYDSGLSFWIRGKQVNPAPDSGGPHASLEAFNIEVGPASCRARS